MAYRPRGGIAARQRGGRLSTSQRIAGVSNMDRLRAGTLSRPDPEQWAIISKAVRERDGNVCVQCGSQHDLTADHIIPHSQGGLTVMSNLRTLCRYCHKKRLGRANKRGARLL